MTYTEPASTPWTFDEVHAAIEHRFTDTPYAVTRTGDKVVIQADLADKTYLTWAWAHHVNEIRGVEVKAKKNGKATTRDYSRSIAVSAGKATLTGKINYASGRQWSLEKNIEYGVGLDGSIGRQVDYTYNTREIQGPVNDILRRSGWYGGPLGSLPADAKIGAFVAIATIVGLALAGLAVLAVSLA
jgi:hypothetical protein